MNDEDRVETKPDPEIDIDGPGDADELIDSDCPEDADEWDDPDYVPDWGNMNASTAEDPDAADDLHGVENLDDENEEDEEAWFRTWWANLPDFIKPDYPLDIPPARLPFVKAVFTLAGAPRHCPEPGCRRSRKCGGGDGPPCYRADRRDLQQVITLAWARLFLDLSEEEFEGALRARSNRYMLCEIPAEAPASPGMPNPRR